MQNIFHMKFRMVITYTVEMSYHAFFHKHIFVESKTIKILKWKVERRYIFLKFLNKN